jgi:predicted DCC family thiol-disulfide oxidoreductase YuxK
MHLGLIVVIDFADLSLGMVMLHLFTFDPAWLRSQKATAIEVVFYDGQCGLCHRVVRFVLAEDPEGNAFRFAPLDSETFRAALTKAEREQLPDSLVIHCVDGTILLKSAGALHILERLGGLWRVLGLFLYLIPLGVRDYGYDAIARTRHSLFRPPDEACPLVPADLRKRFEV